MIERKAADREPARCQHAGHDLRQPGQRHRILVLVAGADIGMMSTYTYMDVYKGDYITRNWETVRSIRKPIIAAVAVRERMSFFMVTPCR